MTRSYNDLDAERIVDAAYRELWSQIEDGRGSVEDGTRALNTIFGEGGADGWYDWLVAETEWTPASDGYGPDEDEYDD